MITSPSFRSQYSGNGVLTTFPYEFPITDQTYVKVVKTSAAGVDTTLIVGVDYSVAGVSSLTPSTWVVTYPVSGTPLASGEHLTLVPNLPVIQSADLDNQGNYFGKTFEGALDFLTVICQMLKEQVDRSVKLPVGTTVSSDTTLASINASVATCNADAASATASQLAAATSAAASAASATASAASAAAAANTAQVEGVIGYNTTVLTNADVTLVANTDVKDQEFSGTLSGPVSIIVSLTGSPNTGQAFWIHLAGIVIAGANILTIKSGTSVIFTISDPGTWTGTFRVVKTATQWKARNIGITSNT